MRVLFTTRGSSGHVGPLAPFARALIRAGHDVLVAVHRSHAANVERLALPLATVDDPPPERWMPLLASFAELDVETAHELMVREYFGRIDLDAALPGVRRIAAAWRPDLVVRESWDLAGEVVAREHDLPLARVGLGLASLEAQTVELFGASGDTPYLTTIPELLEDPSVEQQPVTHRFRHGAPSAAQPLPDWWPGDERPLVYATFGTVTAAAHLPYFPALYRAAIEELAAVDARVLLTVGEDRDLGELGPLPGNVRVERWVAQEAVAAHASAMVSHGGHGTTLGALAHGLPLVVLPLFSGDQSVNARAVERTGAGVALGDGSHPVLGVPDVAGLGAAVAGVLGDGSARAAAEDIADAMRALPPVDTAVGVLAGPLLAQTPDG